MQGASPPSKVPQPLGKAHGPQADLGNRDGGPNRRNDAMGAPIIIDLALKNTDGTRRVDYKYPVAVRLRAPGSR